MYIFLPIYLCLHIFSTSYRDGLADRLQRILAREKSDIYFWHHKKTSSSADEGKLFNHK